MATCKDCLYFKRCVVLGVELDMKHDKEADKNCRHFKNKVDFVEVVRCKDCEFYEHKGDNEFYCRNLMEVMKEDDYCSYGVKKVVGVE